MLKQRVITAVILASAIIAAIFLLPATWFGLLTLIVTLAAAWEWGGLARLTPAKRYAFLLVTALVGGLFIYGSIGWQPLLIHVALPLWLLALYWVSKYPRHQEQWSGVVQQVAIGLLILIPAWLSINLIFRMPDGALWICLLLLMVWGADIGAYFSGRRWGRSKLAANVSPGKTWAGFWGGVASAIAVAWLFAIATKLMVASQPGDWLWFLILAAITATISVLGDLTESMFKRHRGVKDSGKLLPGHGGLLDRLDSLLAALPFFTLILVYWR